MKDQIKFIREKCIEANPDIKKLECGCVIKKYENTSKEILIQIYNDGKTYILRTFRPEYNKYFATLETREYIEGLEIIGRDIRLDDCALIVKEDFLLDLILNWKNGYIQDQTDELLKLIIKNIK